MGGLWEFPGGEGGEPGALREVLRRRHRLWMEVGEPLGEVRHSILERSIRLSVYRARLLRPPRQTAEPGAWRWMATERALGGEIPLSGSARKVLRLVGGNR